MFAKSYKLRWQEKRTPRYSVRFSYFSHTWKQSTERTVPTGRIPGKRNIWSCHISAPLATLFTIHSRPSLPPLESESPSLVICPLWSVLFHAASVNGDAAVRTLPRDGEVPGDPEYFPGAFLSVIKHWPEELDNLIIDLWWKVVSSSPSAVNDSLFCTFPLCFNLKAPLH